MLQICSIFILEGPTVTLVNARWFISIDMPAVQYDETAVFSYVIYHWLSASYHTVKSNLSHFQWQRRGKFQHKIRTTHMYSSRTDCLTRTVEWDLLTSFFMNLLLGAGFEAKTISFFLLSKLFKFPNDSCCRHSRDKKNVGRLKNKDVVINRYRTSCSCQIWCSR